MQTNLPTGHPDGDGPHLTNHQLVPVRWDGTDVLNDYSGVRVACTCGLYVHAPSRTDGVLILRGHLRRNRP